MADETTSRAQALVAQPSESLDTELKSWIDLATPHGKGHLVRAALALRNHGGGQILFGFNDQTRLPEPVPAGLDVRRAFHSDVIQSIVGGFASKPFEVAVEFGERDHLLHPVLFVPAGVRSPVVSRSGLKDGDRTLVHENGVYVRTLKSNRTPSTSLASWQDWDDLIEVCFDNRDANIGRFIRRHLGALTPELLQGMAQTLGMVAAPPTIDPVQTLLDSGEQRFAELIAERNLTLPPSGFWSVASVIEGDVPAHSATRAFLQLLEAHNPRYTGWPLWLDGSSFPDAKKPFVYDDTWQALMVDLETFRGSAEIRVKTDHRFGNRLIRPVLSGEKPLAGIETVSSVGWRIWGSARSLGVRGKCCQQTLLGCPSAALPRVEPG